MNPLATERLRLVPASPDLLDADLAMQLHGNDAALRHELGVNAVTEWPPTGSDHDLLAVDFFRSRLAESPFSGDWYAYYVCLGRELVGSAGFFGPPLDGEVEIGYSICTAHRRRGFALEAVGALVEKARRTGTPVVRARTVPGNHASIELLNKAGFVEAPRDGGHRVFKLSMRSEPSGIDTRN